APHTRRRVVMAARRTEAGILLGYYEAMSHRIVAIEECPISRPEIVGRLDDLRALAALVAASSEPFRLTVTATASGLDVAVDGNGKLSDSARLKAAEFTGRASFARLSVGGE